jgi:hypothetical protein
MFVNCGWNEASLKRSLLTALGFIEHTSVQSNVVSGI